MQTSRSKSESDIGIDDDSANQISSIPLKLFSRDRRKGKREDLLSANESSADTELSAVKSIISRVNETFQQKKELCCQLSVEINEKETQLDYVERQYNELCEINTQQNIAINVTKSNLRKLQKHIDTTLSISVKNATLSYETLQRQRAECKI